MSKNGLVEALDVLVVSKSARKKVKLNTVGSPKKPRVQREAAEQKALVDWANVTTINGLRIGEYLTHVVNEGKRGPKAQREFKELGGSKGYPDLILDIPTKKYAGLRIEMKPQRQFRSNVSQEQADWQMRLKAMGYQALICYGFDEAKETIKEYLRGS